MKAVTRHGETLSAADAAAAPAADRFPIDAFAHGHMLLAEASRIPANAAAWPRVSFGRLTLARHPRTVLAAESRDLPSGAPVRVALIGHPIDVDRSETDGRVIVRHALDALQRSTEDFVRYVAYLDGRFTAYAMVEGALLAVTDTAASQSLYWAGEGDELVIASHVELAAMASKAELDEAALARLARLKSLRPRMTHYFAGCDTPYRSVRPVFANCLLRVDIQSRTVVHERFYPFEERRETGNLEAAYRLFRERLIESCRLQTSMGRTGISLTAGYDSRTTFLAAASNLSRDSFTFTFFNPGANSESHADDLLEANRLSCSLGVQHRVLRWRRATPGSDFDRAFSTTWRAHRPSEGGACAMYEDLPRDFVELQSNLAEIGTVFYRKRNDSPPTPQRLASLYQGQAVAAVQEYVDTFEEFRAYADFKPERFAGWDYHDLFYWEHRCSRWAAQKPQEGDLGHRVLQPFNSRSLIEIMQSLDYESRASKVLQKQFIDDQTMKLTGRDAA